MTSSEAVANEDKPLERGVVMAATGDRCWDEGLVAAESLKRHMPGLPVWAYTDKPRESLGAFDRVEVLPKPAFGFTDKVSAIGGLPFPITLLLDTDTRVIEPFWDLFELMQRVELAAVLDYQRYPLAGCPDYLPEVNTGVLAVRRTEASMRLMTRWASEHEERQIPDGKLGDQVSLRAAMASSDIDFYGLPCEYNFGLHTFNVAGYGGRVRILHGKPRYFDRAEEWLKSNNGARCFVPSVSSINSGSVHGGTPSLRLAFRLVETLRRFGTLVKRV